MRRYLASIILLLGPVLSNAQNKRDLAGVFRGYDMSDRFWVYLDLKTDSTVRYFRRTWVDTLKWNVFKAEGRWSMWRDTIKLTFVIDSIMKLGCGEVENVKFFLIRNRDKLYSIRKRDVRFRRDSKITRKQKVTMRRMPEGLATEYCEIEKLFSKSISLSEKSLNPVSP